jgi:hypothetical protein
MFYLERRAERRFNKNSPKLPNPIKAMEVGSGTDVPEKAARKLTSLPSM